MNMERTSQGKYIEYDAIGFSTHFIGVCFGLSIGQCE